MNEKNDFRGCEQLKAIIGEIIGTQKYPKFDFINGVLSCEDILGNYELWLNWGKLLIVPKNTKHKQAQHFEELDDWNTEEDGTITLIGRKWGMGFIFDARYKRHHKEK